MAYSLVMPKRSSIRDINQMAANVIGSMTQSVDSEPSPKRHRKNPAAVLLGKRGGKKGGPARAKALSSERRTEIARLAAQQRWANKPNGPQE